MDLPVDSLPEEKDRYSVKPDEVDALADELQELKLPFLRIQPFVQHGGRNVYAFTVGDTGARRTEKRRLFVSRPHSHEPAGTAACTEILKMLAGRGDGKMQRWRDWLLEHFILTLVPDANPGGTEKAPVKFWDGTEVSNEDFFLWMFGESGERRGERFPRVPAWDMRETVSPAFIGIAYEQVNDNLYVEPNRDTRSSFFRSFSALDSNHGYQVWLDLHQTEFMHSDRNSKVHLPTCYESLGAEMKALHRDLGAAIHRKWKDSGGFPEDQPVVPYRRDKDQAEFLNRVWKPVAERMVHLVTEVQNNNPRTPVPLQVFLQLSAIQETMNWMLSRL